MYPAVEKNQDNINSAVEQITRSVEENITKAIARSGQI
jgi:hypothetical protein